MLKPSCGALIAVAAVLTLGIPGTSPAQAADPWKKVPAPPTSCFADGDYDGSVVNAGQEMIADKDRQDALNAKLREQFDAMDMMEKARRMQDWMMKNPQAAAELLEAASAADAAQTVAEDLKIEAERLDKVLESHKKAFDSAIDRALQPVDARIDALIKARTRETQVDAVFTTDADYAAYVALVNERNATYEKACAPFFGVGGIFPRWLDEFRSNVSNKLIALEEKGDAATKQELAIMGTPAAGYQTTGRYDVVREYIRRLEIVSRYRRYKAEPTVRLEK